MLFLCLSEALLQFVPVPDWWEAGIFDDYRYSIRLSRWVEAKMGGEFNSLGYRDSEWTYTSTKPRVALLGDSRTFGLMVEEPDTFAARIELLSHWESLNFGRPGATPFEALDSMVPDLRPYQPQAAVLFLDINSSVTTYVTRSVSGHRNNHLRHLLRSLASWRLLEGFIHRRKPRVVVLSTKDHGLLLQQCIDALKDAGVQNLISIIGYTPLQDFPGLWTQSDYQPYLETSRMVSKNNQVPIIELQDVVSTMGDSAFTGAHQIHLSPDGHRALARKIVSILDSETP